MTFAIHASRDAQIVVTIRISPVAAVEKARLLESIGLMLGRPHVVLPYAFDTNDMRFTNGGGFTQADDFATYCIGAFDQLRKESTLAPRMLSIGLHLRIIGRPGRIAGLEKFLAYATDRPDVWFARRDQIAHAWRAANGMPPWTPQAI